jgi:hypothetical protein
MITEKQFNYLKSLLVNKGHAHPIYGLRQSGKDFCGVPRSAMSWDGLKRSLTVREASNLIDRLKK